MRRRDFIAGLLFAATLGRARAQQSARLYRLAIVDPALSAVDLSEDKACCTHLAFYKELRRLGYVEGQNLEVGLYSGAGRGDDFSELAREVVGWKPDVIFAQTNSLVLALKAATTTIPIIGVVGFPIENGIVDALVVGSGTLKNLHLITELTENARLPTIYLYREAVEMGGLMAYAFDLREHGRQAADEADQIFKGAKPGDIPVYQPTTFTLSINLKTAKTIGLTFPDSILARADEVIEFVGDQNA